MIPADQPYQLALDFNPIRSENAGFIGRVCGFKCDRGAFATEALQRCFFIIDEGDDGDRMTERKVPVEYGTDTYGVRLVPLPSGKVALVTGESVSFFEV